MRLKTTKKIKATMGERRKKFQNFRLKSYRLPSTDSQEGKSGDSNGIRTEDIKTCDEETKEMVRQIFNEALKQKGCTPEAWQRIRIKVLHKKGDVEDVGNYRPICSLPALYKLFTTVLYSRLNPRLDQNQSEDQAGF